MATISATDVKKLRDQTGAGMMDCKAALEEAKGDFEEANTILRKKGLASAAKKAGRTTSEGLIGHWVSPDKSSGILVEVNCESDFVARTDDFQALMADLLDQIRQAGDGATLEWLRNPSGPLALRVAEAIGKLGENMAVPRFARCAGRAYVAQYIHMGGKIGVQVEFADLAPGLAAKPELAALARELAMQVAAANPSYASRSEVPVDVLDRERGIYRAQMESSGKPAAVIEKIIEGKLDSFYAQTVLTDQPSIRDPKLKVSDTIAAVAKPLGHPVVVTRFSRLKVGETAA